MHWQLMPSTINHHLRPFHSPGTTFLLWLWETKIRFVYIFLSYVFLFYGISVLQVCENYVVHGPPETNAPTHSWMGQFAWLKAFFCTIVSAFYCSITDSSMLSGRLSPSHGASSGWTWSRRSPDLDGSWEYTEWKVADNREGVLHHNGGAARS